MEDATKYVQIRKAHTFVVAMKDTSYKKTTPHVQVGIATMSSVFLSLSESLSPSFKQTIDKENACNDHPCIMCVICTALPEYTCSSGSSCDQLCAVIDGVDQCSCDIGYQLANDGSTCLGLH